MEKERQNSYLRSKYKIIGSEKKLEPMKKSPQKNQKKEKS
jgi:hypothetical protein